MIAVQITRARAEEAPALARIMGDWCRDTTWVPNLHTPDQDRQFLGKLIETTTVWSAHAPDPVGFLSLDGEDVKALYLAPQARGQGIGARLLDQAKRGHDRLTVWTFQANTGAIRFYLREGFVETNRTDGAGNQEKLPDVHMTWTRKATA